MDTIGILLIFGFRNDDRFVGKKGDGRIAGISTQKPVSHMAISDCPSPDVPASVVGMNHV